MDTSLINRQKELEQGNARLKKIYTKFGLRFLCLRNGQGFEWNHKRV